MPLTGSESTLSAAIKAGLLGNDAANAVDNAALAALCDEIAKAVVAHIVANATVSPVGLPAPMNAGGIPVAGAGSIL